MGKQDIFDTTAIFDEEYEVRSKLTHNILLELRLLYKDVRIMILPLNTRRLGCDNPGP